MVSSASTEEREVAELERTESDNALPSRCLRLGGTSLAESKMADVADDSEELSDTSSMSMTDVASVSAFLLISRARK